MPDSETGNIIKNIVPALKRAGWGGDDMEFHGACKSGQYDILLKAGGKTLAVVEAKKSGKQKKEAMAQAQRYAKDTGARFAVATDYSTFLHVWDMRENRPCLNKSGQPCAPADIALLSPDNFNFWKNNESLGARRGAETLKKVFDKLNNCARDMGVTSGLSRVDQMAKFIFVKMLCDNNVILDADNWDALKKEKDADKLRYINNHLLEKIRGRGFNVAPVDLAESHSSIVGRIVGELDAAELNNENYDINGTLFEEFVSLRFRGGGTNDLGQYFTPKFIVSMMYALSEYDPREGGGVYDPFCGTGGILLHVFNKATQNMPPEEKRIFGRKHLFGAEITGEVSNLAKMSAILAGDGHSNIERGDSISAGNKYVREDRQFDLVITNMPFAPSTPDDCRADYFKMSGGVGGDYAVANFIEHCMNRLAGGRRAVMIAPKGFLTDKALAHFRRQMLLHCDLKAVYILYDGVFYPYTPAHSVVLVADKRAKTTSVDFFHVATREDIETAEKYHKSPERYRRGFFKVPAADILQNDACDLRGLLYVKEPKEGCVRLSDVADLYEYKGKEYKGDGAGLRRLTTPTSIKDGVELAPNKSNKKSAPGAGSFTVRVQKGALVVARISNVKKDYGRFLGSARAGKNAGHLLTKEYHQIFPKKPEYADYILDCMRTAEFQKITMLAKGTGGQQRVDAEILMAAQIPAPTPARIKKAAARIAGIQNIIGKIAQLNADLTSEAETYGRRGGT